MGAISKFKDFDSSPKDLDSTSSLPAPSAAFCHFLNKPQYKINNNLSKESIVADKFFDCLYRLLRGDLSEVHIVHQLVVIEIV